MIGAERAPATTLDALSDGALATLKGTPIAPSTNRTGIALVRVR